jgi:DNA anti-recombination protein RmuC
MNAPLRLAVHGAAMDEENAESEVDVGSNDVALLLEQVKALRASVEAMTARVNDALRHAQAATVELYGVAGNPGLSQQVFALRERTDGAIRSLERELEASRNHAAQMFKLALDQQAQMAESLRAAIHGVEASMHQVRDALDGRARDLDASVGVQIDATARDLIERLDDSERSLTGRIEAEAKSTAGRFTDVNGFIKHAQASEEQAQWRAKLRDVAVVIACIALTAWSLFGIWTAIKGPG